MDKKQCDRMHLAKVPMQLYTHFLYKTQQLCRISKHGQR